MSKGWTVAAILTVSVIFLAAYAGSPFLAARDFIAAARSGDADKLEASVDFPSVRETLKSQLNAKITQKALTDPEANGSLFAGLSMMFGPAIVDKMVDAYVTPDGMAALLGGNRVSLDKAYKPSPETTDVDYSYEYISLDRFRVKAHAKDKPESSMASLVWERRGLFTWKLVRFDLPQTIFDDDKKVAVEDRVPQAPEPVSEAQTDPTPVVAEAAQDAEVDATPDQVNGAKTGMVYSDARIHILGAGFTPVPRSSSSDCDPDEHLQCNLPEAASCSQGQEFCNYLFRRANEDLRVLGKGGVSSDPAAQTVDAIMIRHTGS